MRHPKLFNKPYIIRRPSLNDWDQMFSILKKENFHNIGGEEMRDFPLKDCFIVARAEMSFMARLQKFPIFLMN